MFYTILINVQILNNKVAWETNFRKFFDFIIGWKRNFDLPLNAEYIKEKCWDLAEKKRKGRRLRPNFLNLMRKEITDRKRPILGDASGAGRRQGQCVRTHASHRVIIIHPKLWPTPSPRSLYVYIYIFCPYDVRIITNTLRLVFYFRSANPVKFVRTNVFRITVGPTRVRPPIQYFPAAAREEGVEGLPFGARAHAIKFIRRKTNGFVSSTVLWP